MTAPAKCGGTNRQGGPCGNPAGFSTSHPGWGNCKWHGGSTPTGIAHAAKLQAKAEAVRLGAAIDVDAADALRLAVKLATGEVEHLRHRLAEAEASGSEADLRALLSAFATAIERLARISKAGVDADLDEKALALDALILDRIDGAIRAAITDAGLGAEDAERLNAALGARFRELAEADTRPRLTP